MAGYLDHYGAGEERREKSIKRLVSLRRFACGGRRGRSVFAVQEYRQERQVKTLLRSAGAPGLSRRRTRCGAAPTAILAAIIHSRSS
jgi:hypothetical protein